MSDSDREVKWILVPAEPTQVMWRTLLKDMPDHIAFWWKGHFVGIYRTMLAAAPQPPRLTEHEITQIWSEAIVTAHRNANSDVILFARAIEARVRGD